MEKIYNRILLVLAVVGFILFTAISWDDWKPYAKEFTEEFIEICENKSISSTDKTVSNSELEKASVLRVVDGDTLVVYYNGEECRVRLIGIDTPESVHPDETKNTDAGVAASEYTKSQLPEGSIVYLQKDTSEADRYGRLLRYVWIDDDVDVNDRADIETYMYNAVLLKEGYAELMEIEPDTAYADIFREIYEE